MYETQHMMVGAHAGVDQAAMSRRAAQIAEHRRAARERKQERKAQRRARRVAARRGQGAYTTAV